MISSTQCSDNLCQAIEIIANKVVQGLNYDKTILCTITDNKNANRGEYIVSDGVSSYSVYSSNQTYKINAQVYVLIPNGDYQAQKLIISEYSPADEIEKGYSSPSDIIIPVETIYNTSDEIGLKANVNGEGNIGSAIKIISFSNMNLNPKYTRLLLGCEFRTAFKEEIQSGNYSVVIAINGLDKDGSEIEDKKYVFDCNNFFGNPYNFEGGVQQSIVFDISIFSKINAISAQFQESGNFYNKDRDYLLVAEENNIFLEKFSMIAGFDISEYKNNDLLITTTNDLSYENEEEKKLQLNWIRNRNNNTLFSINSITDIDSIYFNYLNSMIPILTKEVTIKDKKYCFYLYEVDPEYDTLLNKYSDYYYGYSEEFMKDNNYTLVRFYKNDLSYKDNYTVGYYSILDDGFGISWKKDILHSLVKGTLLTTLTNNNYVSFYWYKYNLYDNFYDKILNEDLWKLDKYYNNNNYSEKEIESCSAKKILTPFDYSFRPSIQNSREKIKAAITINGCLRKKTLKLQNIELSPGEIITATILEEKEKPYYMTDEQWGEKSPKEKYRLSYDYTYYSPLEEINVEEILSESDHNKKLEQAVCYRSFYYDSINKEYVELQLEIEDKDKIPPKNEGELSKNYYTLVEWVQYYKQSKVSLNDDNIPIKENGNIVYIEDTNPLYLTDKEYNELKNETFNYEEEGKTKNIYAYNFINYPITTLKSKEIIFENKDEGVYKKLNLIKDIKLEATDELQGNYLIYDFSNTIPETTANRVRNIKATISSINSKDVITGNVIFQWKFPKFNTMLNEPQSVEVDNEFYRVINSSDGKLHWTDNGDGFYISSEVEILNSESGKADETVELSAEIPYTIKKYYSPNQHNNKIIFLAYKKVNGSNNEDLAENKEKNKKEINLSFGSSGTNGTNYTFVLNLGCKYKKNENNYIRVSEINQSFLNAADEKNWIKVEPHLYEGNKELEIDNNYSIKWSWYIYPYFKEKRDCLINKNEKETKNLNYKTVDWENPSNNVFYIRTCKNNNLSDDIDISIYTNQDALKTSTSFKGRYHCAILKATINYNSKPLEAYLPIPMSFKSEVYSYDGVEKIVYNANGTNPQYYQNQHKIFKINEETNSLNEIPVDYVMCINHEKVLNNYSYPYFDTNKKVSYKGTSFLLYDILHEDSFDYYCGYNDKEFTIQPDGSKKGTLYKFSKSDLSYIGVLKNITINENDVTESRIKFTADGNTFSATSNCERILKAQPIYYTSNSIPKVSIIARDLDEATYYVQPVLIIQNRFGNSMLNEWDGKLVVDNENNYILSAQVGAGIKNEEDNSFTGVLMGNVTRSEIGSGVSKIGLYGYNSGALTFGFDIDGKAFLGASGNGRILIDGNGGTITSQSYEKEENPCGLKINLNTGELDSKNAGGQITINPENSSSLFKVQGYEKNTLKTLINIGSNSYYLQSANYNSDNGIGLNINLNTGRIISRNTNGIIDINPSSSSSLFNIKNSNNQTLINIGSSYYLQSADYISGVKGFQLNLKDRNFYFQSILPKGDYDNAGIILSNNSNNYLKISKNKKKLAKNILIGKNRYDLYINPWGSTLYLRNCSTGDIYRVKNKKPNEIKVGVEKTGKTFTMNSTNPTGVTLPLGNIYRILGDSGLNNLIEGINENTNIEKLENVNYNKSQDRLEKKDEEGTGEYDGIYYTIYHYPLEYADIEVNKNQKRIISAHTGHTNSIAYQPGSNRFFITRIGKPYTSDNSHNLASYICDFTTTDSTPGYKNYYLKDENNKELESTDKNGNTLDPSKKGFIWQIAIPEYNDKILYVCAKSLYKYTMNNYDENFIYNSKIIEVKDFKDNNYTYQGLEADNKYFYFPRFKTGNYNIQEIQVLNINTGKQEHIISFKSIDPKYEIEELCIKNNYMYVSFSRVPDGYVTKIYQFKFSNSYIPQQIDLSEAIKSWAIINDDSEKANYSNGQGFTLGSMTFLDDKKNKKATPCFICGFQDPPDIDLNNGLILITPVSGSNLEEEEKINLLLISKNNYYLQSENYNYYSAGSASNTGFKLDLQTGHLYAFNFNMQLGKDNGSYMKIDSTAGTYPIQVYGPTEANGDRKRCVISWNGILIAEGANITGNITATSGSFNDCTIKNTCSIQKGLQIGSWKVGDASLYYIEADFGANKAFLYPGGKSITHFGTTQNWVFGVGSNFGVTASGALYASAGKIGDCTISSGKLQVPAANISGELSADSVKINNASIKSLSVDKLTAGTCGENAKFTDINASGGHIGPWYISSNGGLYAEGTGPNNEVLKVFMQKPGATIEDSLLKADWVYSIQKQKSNNPKKTYTPIYYVNSAGQCHAREYYSYYLESLPEWKGSLDSYIKKLWDTEIPDLKRRIKTLENLHKG